MLRVWFLILQVEDARSFELSWVQYSDRASLPQSLHARQELRLSLDRVKMDKLSTADRTAVRKLKTLLDEVIEESLREAEAEAKTDTKGGSPATAPLRPERLALLVLLILLGWGGLMLTKPLKAQAAAKAAAKVADDIVAMERIASESKPVPPPVKRGEVFPEDVAQALCMRITCVLKGHLSNKTGKATSTKSSVLDTKELAAQLAQHHGFPAAEAADKALRKEKKKLRQRVDVLQKNVEEASKAEKNAVAKAAELESKVAENTKRIATATKGRKNPKAEADLEVARKLADDAQKAVLAKAADVQMAAQAVGHARKDEDRPTLLIKMEGVWLSAVTEAWRQSADKLGGTPTPSHIQAWAQDQSLRQKAERSYLELVAEKGFLD